LTQVHVFGCCACGKTEEACKFLPRQDILCKVGDCCHERTGVGDDKPQGIGARPSYRVELITATSKKQSSKKDKQSRD
jgi:hypothetical protein